MRERRVGKFMALASKHLATSRPERARATTPRGTCTAAEGLDAETFRGFQLAGELFLLTSFFIEPTVHSLHERLRNFVEKAPASRFGQVSGTMLRLPESTAFRQYGPFRAARYVLMAI